MLHPYIDDNFNLYHCIEELGFSINEKDDGYYVASGSIDDKHVIIEFYNSFITGVQSDMLIHVDNRMHSSMDQIYYGVAPHTKKDFELLIQLLFPSKEFIEELRGHYIAQYPLDGFTLDAMFYDLLLEVEELNDTIRKIQLKYLHHPVDSVIHEAFYEISRALDKCVDARATCLKRIFLIHDTEV